MLKIKLFPKGKKHQRTFRIVVAEARSKFNGKIVADLGFITPQSKTLQLDKDLFAQWVKNGAQVTVGVDRLLNPDKHPKKIKPKKVTEPKEKKVNPVAAELKVEETKPIEEKITEVKSETPTEEVKN